jgi:hypothetical protein
MELDGNSNSIFFLLPRNTQATKDILETAQSIFPALSRS